MSPDELNALIKKLRKKPIYDGRGGREVDYGTATLHRILPHRAPFLLIDRVDLLDLDRKIIRGRRLMDPSDRIYEGHFPGTPVYPGCLQVEMTGQLGLCLAHFITKETDEITPDATPAEVRALRVLHAVYQLPVVPGDEVEIHAALLDEDGMTATCAGQIIKNGQVASCAVQEVYFVD